MTNQEIFNKVWEHFVVNKNPRSTVPETESCRYRLDGTAECPIRCAVGILIPDKDYTPAIEGYPVSSSHVRILFTEENYPMLSSLQHAHDCAESLDELQLKLIGVSKTYKLDIPNAACRLVSSSS